MRRLGLLFASIATSFVLFAAPAAADINDFTITDFSADETLTNSDKQGELHIVERISVQFTAENHGILRAIPQNYHNLPLDLHINRITSESGAPTKYSTYGLNGNEVIKIGDPNRTVTGTQEYTIDYTLHNVISFYDDHDELYWDVNGDQWDQATQTATATLHLPNGAHVSTVKPICFAGGYGSSDEGCTITTVGNTITTTAQGLQARQTLTYVVGFQKGFFAPEGLGDKLHRYAGPAAKLLALPLVAGAAAFGYWLKKGRDAKGRGTIVPQYGPPAGLSPIEVGTVIDFKVDGRDITATIIDLAVRGYIKIIQSTQKKLLRKDAQNYSLQLLKVDTQELADYEQTILKAIFDTYEVGNTVDISAMQYKFAATATKVKKSVEDRLVTNGYFKTNPLKVAQPIRIVAIIGLFIVFLIGQSLGGYLFGSLIITAAILFTFASIMPARTEQGALAKEDILGLKMYLKTAEADRLKMLQSPNAPYAPNAEAPVKTVELFEKLLPYAMVLGVENDWAKQFNDIYKQPPDWYSGNWTAFNAGYLVGSLNSGFSTNVNSAFAAPSSSGSSGFSGGGGFAGGGGGGGGGGGW